MDKKLKKEAGTMNRAEEREYERTKGSGQQTAGKRGEGRNNKRNEEHYRSSEQKRQRGNHGGNR
jgi:hypothetical protein